MTFGHIGRGEFLVSCDTCLAVVPARGVRMHEDFCHKVQDLIRGQEILRAKNHAAIMAEINTPWRDGQPQP